MLGMPKTGWVPFILWALPGAVVGLQITALGILLLPLAFLAIVLLTKRTRIWPESIGAIVGIAAVLVAIGLINSDYWTCPPSGKLITRTATSMTIESCGEVNPLPWLLGGGILAFVAPLSYAVQLQRKVTGESNRHR